MEAQRIVVNGRNLPVHRWIELNEEAAANEAFNTYSQETNMYTDVAAKPQVTAVPETNYQQLNASKQSTEESTAENTESGSNNVIDSSKKPVVTSPEHIVKNLKRSKHQFKNQNAQQQLKARYKTELCRHFKRTGYCPLEQTCQFAHGNHELRRPTDPLPEKFDDKSLGAVHSNYKTSACRNFSKTGQCKFGASCSFFHFPSERRKLTDPLPNLMLQQQQQVTNGRVFVNKDGMQANSNMDFGVYNNFNQQMGYGMPQLDEIAVAGGFDPNKYMVPLAQPMPSFTGMKTDAAEWKPPTKGEEATAEEATKKGNAEE